MSIKKNKDTKAENVMDVGWEECVMHEERVLIDEYSGKNSR